MRAWFDDLAPREKGLIAIAALLLVLVILIQFIALPLLRAHTAAKAENRVAALTLAQVSQSAQQAGSAVSEATQVLTPDAYRRTLVTTARARGLSVSRIQSTGQNGIMVVMDAASPQTLFAWLAELEGANDISPSEVVLSDAGTGQVRASIEFGGR